MSMLMFVLTHVSVSQISSTCVLIKASFTVFINIAVSIHIYAYKKTVECVAECKLKKKKAIGLLEPYHQII